MIGRPRSEGRLWVWLAIATVGPLFLFTNLYAMHDYYVIAIAPALAALVAGGIDRALDIRPSLRPLVTVAGSLAIVLTTGVWIRSFVPSDPERILPESSSIAAATSAGDLVVIQSEDWNPAYLFYAERRGLMLHGLPAPAGVEVFVIGSPTVLP